ncbi:RepB family plasmid replication initiator protein [Azospirillum brasilense]|nr:RepB family plasmid replication initiator protein [Azospirillum argentinense]
MKVAESSTPFKNVRPTPRSATAGLAGAINWDINRGRLSLSTIPFTAAHETAMAIFTKVRAPQMTAECRRALFLIAEAVKATSTKQNPGPLERQWVAIELTAHQLLGPTATLSDSALTEAAASLLDRLSDARLNGVPGRNRLGRCGAALLAEWHVEASETEPVRGRNRNRRSGPICKILLSPSAVEGLLSGTTLLRLDSEAARNLTGHARTLLELLLDRRSSGAWSPSLDELKARLGIPDRYANSKDFRVRCLDPAVAAINATGALAVATMLEREGRAVRTVHFTWTSPESPKLEKNDVEEFAAGIAGEPPLVVMDRVATWLRGQSLAVRRAWWGRAQECGAPRRPKATDADSVGSWVGWIADELAQGLSHRETKPKASSETAASDGQP